MRVLGTVAAALAGPALLAGHGVAVPHYRLAPCRPDSNERTTLIIDGDLYAYVRSTDRRYIFGWSGPPVLSFPEAFHLIRLLGVKAAPQQIFTAKHVIGGMYTDGGSIAFFDFSCSGRYDAKAVVRVAGPTRFWLQESRGANTVSGRAFCMTAQNLPKGALLITSFTRPLAAAPPTFGIDLDRDGRIDRRGRFAHGGARFPNTGPGGGC